MQYNLERVEVRDDTAFIQFKDPNEVELLDMKFDNLRVDELGGAEIDVVDDGFQWSGKKSSKGSSIEDLTLPNRGNLIIVKNCDIERIK